MLRRFFRLRNLRRYQQIVSIFAKHGFGSVMEQLQVTRYLPLPGIIRKRGAADQRSPAEHFRLALEELGPTFIKIGQIFSTRPDLLPTEFILELTKLQDSVAPTDWENMQALLQEEYGERMEQTFAAIDPEPLGSASLSQVHAARLIDGSQVVMKIQRPNILRTIRADLEILSDLAVLAQQTSWGEMYNPTEIVGQFATQLHNELDYRLEGNNADRFRANFENEPHLYVPKIFWEISTFRVLVMERLYGVKISQVEELDRLGYDREQVASHAARIFTKEVVDDGFFHADPHAGNFVVMPGKEPDQLAIGVMDFGMVGYISKADRINILQIYLLAGRMDSRGIVSIFLRIGAASSASDLLGLERALDRLISQYRGAIIQRLPAQRLFEELMQIAFHYRLYLPTDTVLLLKTLVMMEGLARQLAPDFDFLAAFGPPVQKVMHELRLPWVLGQNLLYDLESLAFAMHDLPSVGEQVMRGLQRGELPFSLKMGANKETMDRLERITTRLALSLLASALIIGQALLLPVAAGNPAATALVVAGFGISLILGLWLVLSMLRHH